MSAPLDQRFLQGLGAVPLPLGLAVSGGGDSRALLELALRAGLAVQAVTVDHGLRPEAAAEAAEVGRVCAAAGVPHQVLRWQHREGRGWDGRGNLMDAARRARARLIGEWAREQGLAAVALGHTRDDVAETFLMRLARGAGVDGLSAMAPRWRAEGVLWLRPLLAIGRAELRDWLAAEGCDWIEDPSNEAERFDRVRARRALVALAPLGLGAGQIAAAAGHLAEVRRALELQALAAAAQVARAEAGDLLIDRARLAALPDEVQRRVLLLGLGWFGSAEYGPRGAAVQRFRAALLAGRAAQLAGVRVLPGGAVARLCRDQAALPQEPCDPREEWDGRWRISGPDFNGLALHPLGATGLAQRPLWRGAGLPRAALMVQPALWRGGDLVAAPVLDAGCPYRAEVTRAWPPGHDCALSH